MIITRAPFRISLGGGGTDLPSYYTRFEGFVLSAAINKYVFIVINRPEVDERIILKYSESELVEAVEQIRHPLFREALRLVGIDRRIEIASVSDIPAGSGLGSSGSFLVSLLSALHTLRRESIPLQTIAEEAYRIESELLGLPVGKHDQYLAAFGGLTCLKIKRDGTVHVSPLCISAHHMEELRNSVLLFYTGILRRSQEILAQQRAETLVGREKILDSLHVTKEIGLEIKRALETGEIRRFGELLDRHWHNKKRRSNRISNPQIDRWYAVAKDNGAIGGKIMGAGGGGFFMFVCSNEHKGQLRRAMEGEGLAKMNYMFDFEGAKVLVNL